MADREQYRRMLLKISTAVMISIVGPASAWSVMEEKGLFLYIITYMTFKLCASTLASKSTKVAIFSYRYAPFLLVISGLLAFIPGSIITYGIVMPILLGSYEGAYWAVFFDYKPWFKNECISVSENTYKALGRLGIEPPASQQLQKAALTSVPFAICQFVIKHSMMLVALQRGVLWLGIFVVIAELTSYLVVLAYRRITQGSSSLQQIQRRLWVIGQVVVLVGITSMVLGHSIGLFSLFLFGWLLSQGSSRGCLRKIEIQWSQNHLSGKELESKRNPDLERFQRNEVVAAMLGVALATILKVESQYNFDPALVGALVALLAFCIRFPKISFQITSEVAKKQIGLRERMKFKSHFVICLLFILPVIFLTIKVVVLLLLLSGFAMSIIAVIWSVDQRILPTAI